MRSIKSVGFVNPITKKVTYYNEMTGRQINNGECYLSTGNKKLISNPDETMFLIWSIPAKKTCPFSTAHCRKNCYAEKAEKNYPDCRPCRERNLTFTKRADFVDQMVRRLHAIAMKPNYKSAPHITVRIHESGDFYSYEYMLAGAEIALACMDIPNMDFAVYTKSLCMFLALRRMLPSQICVRHSIWDDTNPETVRIIEENNLPIYTACKPEELPYYLAKGYTLCECSDCGHCRKCFDATIKKIVCIIHGFRAMP